VRCTFYVDGDILAPWEEEWPVPPERGRVMKRHGARWLITRVVIDEWPGILDWEAGVWLELAPDSADDSDGDL
jgi:hypothetical protein